jgi:hypothetical protein
MIPKAVFCAMPLLFSLSACGGGGGSSAPVVSAPVSAPVTFSGATIKVFEAEAGGAGVGRVVSSEGQEMVIIAPNIVSQVANASSIDPDSSVDISLYPIASVQNGYNYRTGTKDGVNVVVAEKIGTNRGSIVYLYDNSGDALATGATKPIAMPTGTLTYNGIYVVGNRGSNWKEVGSAAITANFGTNTFSLSATSTDTTLTGNGIIDNANGRISSNNLVFTDVVMGNYTASTAGNVGSSNGQDITGVWYTNDTAPDFAGAYAVTR